MGISGGGNREWYGFCEWGLGHMTMDDVDYYRVLVVSRDVSREDIFCACQSSGVECGCRGHFPARRISVQINARKAI